MEFEAKSLKSQGVFRPQRMEEIPGTKYQTIRQIVRGQVTDEAA